MSEQEDTAAGAVGWEPGISSYKAAVEAALIADGRSFWILPEMGKPPANLAEGVVLPRFAYGAAADFARPPVPEGVFPMASGTALALQAVLNA